MALSMHSQPCLSYRMSQIYIGYHNTNVPILSMVVNHKLLSTLIAKGCPKWLHQNGPFWNCLQMSSTEACLNVHKGRIHGGLAYKASELLLKRRIRFMEFHSASKLRSLRQRDLPVMSEIEDYKKQLQELQGKVDQMIEEGDIETARVLIDANYEALTEQLEQGIEGVEQALMLDVLAQLHMSLQDFEDAEQILEQIKGIMEKVDNHEPLVDTILQHMGRMYSALGLKNEALFFYRKTLEIQENILGEGIPLLETLLLLASVYRDLERRDESINIYQRIIGVLESSKGADCEELSGPLLHLGHNLLEENRLDEAEVTMYRGLRLAENTDRKNDGRVGVAICALARVKCAKDEFKEAARLFQRGLQILRNSNISPSHPILESTRTEVAEFFSLMRMNKEAQGLWEENLHEKERLVGPDSPELVIHLQNLASSYALDWNFEKCEPLLRRSLQLATTGLGPTAPQVSVPLACLASTLHNLGKYKEAEALARHALNIRENTYAANDPVVGEACNLLASILHALDRDEEAVSLMRRVLSIEEEVLGSDNPELCNTLDFLTELLSRLGRTSEASSVAERYQRLAAEVNKL